MDKYWMRVMVTVVFLVAVPACADAQQQPPPAVYYTQAQLDQLLAPIALYTDPLVAQILMAATYPLEVVQADRWLQDPQNGSLHGDHLTAVLQDQPWDPSVKSLVPFPQILQMMDKNLQWTEQVGDAFLADQAAVMDSVQHLRQLARVSGTLQSTPQQVVSTQNGVVLIMPGNTQTVYIPYYDPTEVYGVWPYPAYPPYYFQPPIGFSYRGAVIGFSIGFAISAPFWGWGEWDWHNHRIHIDNDRFRRINRDRQPIFSNVWQHDPAHRQGVPYRSPATRTRYQQASEEARRSARGYGGAAPQVERTSPSRVSPAERRPTGAARPAAEVPKAEARVSPAERRPTGAARPAAEVPKREPAATLVPRPVSRPAQAAPAQRPAAPLFESLPHGSEARGHAAQGASSRSAPDTTKDSSERRGERR